MSEESDTEAQHSVIHLGEIEDVECPDGGEEYRYCPYCGDEL